MGTTLAVYFERGPVSDLQGITILLVAPTLPAAAVVNRALEKEKGKGSLFLGSKTVWRLIFV